MFLEKNTYVGDAHGKLKIAGIKSHIQISRVKHITEEVIVWRKANAIHKWFVDNVQDGNDNNCQYVVSTEKLKQLILLCKQVQKDPDNAPDILPTQEGFLFGNTKYDNRYFQNIDYTVDALKNEFAMGEDNRQEYIYQSDW